MMTPTMRRAIGAPPPAEPETLQRLRLAIWDEVEQAEQQRPELLRALRDQQQDLQRQGVL